MANGPAMRDDATPHSMLGTGWSFPPRFSAGGGSVEMVAGVDDIHQSLQILLGTQLGERLMHEHFGCDLNRVLFEEVDQGLINSISSLVADAVLYHEPRIKLESLDVSQSGDDAGLLLIALHYCVRATNSRFNMVYPFYLNEATIPGS